MSYFGGGVCDGGLVVGEGKVILCKLDQGWVVEEGIVEGGVWGRGDIG